MTKPDCSFRRPFLVFPCIIPVFSSILTGENGFEWFPITTKWSRLASSIRTVHLYCSISSSSTQHKFVSVSTFFYLLYIFGPYISSPKGSKFQMAKSIVLLSLIPSSFIYVGFAVDPQPLQDFCVRDPRSSSMALPIKYLTITSFQALSFY